MIKLCLIFLLFIGLFYLINQLKNKKPYLSGALKIILVSILIEVFVFNINSFRTSLKNYNIINYSANDLNVFNMDYNQENDEYTFIEDIAIIEIENINKDVATVKLDIQIIEESSIEYQIDYTDKTSKNYRGLPKKVLAQGVERSKYTVCYLSGSSERLAIELYGAEGCKIKINNITLNENVPFNFSIIRFMSLATIAILIYSLINGKTFNMPYSETKPEQGAILSIIVMIFICITIWINLTTHIANGIYEEYIESIMNGQISLLEKPTDELNNLDNPYDVTQRGEIEYLWDCAYYNNTYYIYFGILPAIILFIPLRFLGIYLPEYFGVLVFSIGIIINLSKIIKILYKRWFSNINFSYLILAIIGILSGSLVFWINRRPQTYELVLSAGIFFVTLGFYFMFKAIEDKEKVKYVYLCLSAITYALAVACRPNLLLVSLCYIPIIIKVLKMHIKEKKNIIKTICLIGFPYLIIGILLMVFNYIRFDNPFEFGTSYQLTVNDMRNLEYRLMTIPVGIVTQLFKFPVTTNTFPFYIHQQSTLPFFGYYYVESLVCGLFILNPINLILLFLIRLKSRIKDKEAYNYTCIFTVIAFIICIANIVLAGTLQRYSMDYAWILNITSYLTLFMIINNIKSIEIKKYILRICIGTTIFMFIINMYVGGLISENNFLKQIKPVTYYKIMYNICFWE